MFFNSERMNHSIIADRVLSVVAIWVSSFVILKYKRAIKKRDKNKEDYIDSIEKMAFQVSHEVRRPICHIQGISNILDSEDFSKEDLEKICFGIKDSVAELDVFTKTLTDFLEKVHKRIK
jgi:light-regulated signal transduction histidine kinase (bacteriophytochrome)